jgi:hypothetical protein
VTIHYPTPAASLPDVQFTWNDADGNIIDFSTGWTFKMTIGRPPNAAAITKTSGIVGHAQSPNIIVIWNPNELISLTPGVWYFQITASYGPSGGKQRVMTGSLRIDQPVLA